MERVKENLEHARKKPRNVSNWKRTKDKATKYRPKGLPRIPTCNHSKTNAYKCNTLNGQNCFNFHNKFYLCKDKISQDSFILAYTKSNSPSRTDRRFRGTAKHFSTKYYVRNNKGILVRVCLTAFTNILRVGVRRVQGIVKRFFESGTAPRENRGGNRRREAFEAKKQSVKNFIKRFHVHEIHYCRSKNSARQYISGDLSINRIFKMYNNNHPDLQVTKWYFQNIFRTNFNISFKTPSTDQCSKCIMYKEKIKMCKNPTEKVNVMTAKRVHTLRSKAFYSLIREESANIITFSFDCQKNMPLPKLFDQAAYFSRQLNLYNFGIVKGTSKSPLIRENIFLYLWTEAQRPKGCNEITSAVFNNLNHTNFAQECKIVRLICDGCGAQNKNTAMIAMCSYWLKINAPSHIEELQIIFPVPGHSYIPPDRVFAMLEKRTKSKNTIIEPKTYEEIYSEYGTTIQLGGNNAPLYDWKTYSRNLYKPTTNWHFEFNKSKRFIINMSQKGKILVRGESAYKSDLTTGSSVLKKSRSISRTLPDRLYNGRAISSAKVKDIDGLLEKHFGDDWKSREDLSFYKNLFQNQIETLEENLSNENYECDTFFEDIDLRI